MDNLQPTAGIVIPSDWASRRSETRVFSYKITDQAMGDSSIIRQVNLSDVLNPEETFMTANYIMQPY
jgi:hypothetical protein